MRWPPGPLQVLCVLVAVLPTAAFSRQIDSAGLSSQSVGQAQSWRPARAVRTILQRSPMIDEFLDWEAHERQQKQETKNRFVTIGV